MSKSEPPKEGDVVLVPSGMPYIVKKRPAPKKGARKLAKKKKLFQRRLEPGEHEGEKVFIDPEEEAEIEEWEQQMLREEKEKEYKKSKRRVAKRVVEEPTFGEEGDEGEEGEEGDEGEEGGGFGEEGDEDLSPPSSPGEEMEELRVRKEEGGVEPRYEIQEEFIYKKVPIPEGQREQASKLGITLPQYEMKLLPEEVRRRIYDTEIRYPSYQRMRVGPDGELLPIVEPKPRPIKIYGEDIPSKPKISYSPPKRSPPKDNPYDKRYPVGAYVSFSDIPEGAGMVKGIVLYYTERGVSVSASGTMHFVEYSNPTLKLTPRPQPKKTPPRKKQDTVEDFLVSTEIPEMFRSTIIDTYTKILKTIKEPFKPSKKVSIINWELLQRPPLSWDEYYTREYQSWVFAKYHTRFLEEIDHEEIENEARRLVALESSVDGLLEQVIGILPDGLWYTTTINDVLGALKQQKNLTVFQAQLINTLEQEIVSGGGGSQEYVTRYVPAPQIKGVEEIQKYYRQPGRPPILRTSPGQVPVQELVEKAPISGKALANILKNAIESYQRVYQPDFESTLRVVTHVAMRDRFNNYEPTEEDRRDFEIENLEKLVNLHIAAEKEYDQEKKKADLAHAETQRIQELVLQEDEQLESSIKRFEQLVYAAHGDTVHSYLSNALIPYIFLDGPVAPHAKFFREKLANGSFEFSELTSANIAHYLPEFAMNQKLTDRQWEEAHNILGTILNNNIINLIELYISSHDPFSTTTTKSTLTHSFNLADALIKMLEDPSDICFKETGTGVRPVIKSGKYVRKPGSEELLMEKIPPGEMTICYSNGKFTCHEISAILRAISTEEEPVNTYTGEPYPAEFIAKIKQRYADRLQDPALWQEPGDPVPSPPKPKRVSPPKGKKTPPKLVAVKKKERPHHIPSKKSKGKVEKIAVVGDYFDILTAFASDFKVFVKDSKGQPITKPLTFEFTESLKDPKINVIVLGFDARHPESISKIKVKIPQNTFVYAIGVNAEGVKPLERKKLTARVQKAYTTVEHTFYVDTTDDEDLLAALTDVVVDVEALKAF